MQKHAHIKFNWQDRDEERWLFWLEKKLERLGFEVSISPIEESSKKLMRDEWLAKARAAYNVPVNNIFVVPHDPGCLTILSYLQALSEKNITDPVMLVAGTQKQTGVTKNLQSIQEASKNFLQSGSAHMSAAAAHHKLSKSDQSSNSSSEKDPREVVLLEKREELARQTAQLALLSEKVQKLDIKLVILCSTPAQAPLLQSGHFLIV